MRAEPKQDRLVVAAPKHAQDQVQFNESSDLPCGGGFRKIPPRRAAFHPNRPGLKLGNEQIQHDAPPGIIEKFSRHIAAANGASLKLAKSEPQESVSIGKQKQRLAFQWFLVGNRAERFDLGGAIELLSPGFRFVGGLTAQISPLSFMLTTLRCPMIR